MPGLMFFSLFFVGEGYVCQLCMATKISCNVFQSFVGACIDYYELPGFDYLSSVSRLEILAWRESMAHRPSLIHRLSLRCGIVRQNCSLVSRLEMVCICELPILCFLLVEVVILMYVMAVIKLTVLRTFLASLSFSLSHNQRIKYSVPQSST